MWLRIAVFRDDPGRWYVSAATGLRDAHGGASARGRLYRWDGSWTELAAAPDSMPYALVATEAALARAWPTGGFCAAEIAARAGRTPA